MSFIDTNSWRVSGTVASDPKLSRVGKVGLFYLKTFRPAKGRKNIMILKITVFGRMARKAFDLIKRDMRIECWGQLKTSTYSDKRYMALGLTKDQALRWSLELVMRDFTFASDQWVPERVAEAMNVAFADEWIDGGVPDEGDGHHHEKEDSGSADIGI